jgi:hypothetical protein
MFGRIGVMDLLPVVFIGVMLMQAPSMQITFAAAMFLQLF